MQKLGKIFAETGITRQEEIPIAPFLKPLKRAEIAQGASELTFIGLLPEVGLREGVLVRPAPQRRQPRFPFQPASLRDGSASSRDLLE